MIELKLTPEQLKALGLDGEEEVTQERFATALDAILAKASGGEEHGQQLQTITAERDAALAKLKEIEDAKSMEEVEALLADYDIPEESAATLKELALADREKATKLLGGMRKKEALKTEEGAEGGAQDKFKKAPPGPVHTPEKLASDPASQSEEERLAEADKLIGELRKEGRFPDYSSAREEIRRRRPELFA